MYIYIFMMIPDLVFVWQELMEVFSIIVLGGVAIILRAWYVLFVSFWIALLLF